MITLKHFAMGIGMLLVGAALFVSPIFSQPSTAVAAIPVVETVKQDRFANLLQPADVKVLLDKGHGSAVHIGNGAFLTAAHVVEGPTKRLDIKLADKSIRRAEVLWVSKEYDIALIRADGRDIASSSLSCQMAKVGDNITLTGNPMSLEDITAFGRIAGAERTIGNWKSVLVVSAPTIPGQSGGAVYNEKHEIVGITVGLMGVQLGMFPSASGYGTIVPSKTVCSLLGRSA